MHGLRSHPVVPVGSYSWTWDLLPFGEALGVGEGSASARILRAGRGGTVEVRDKCIGRDPGFAGPDRGGRWRRDHRPSRAGVLDGRRPGQARSVAGRRARRPDRPDRHRGVPGRRAAPGARLGGEPAARWPGSSRGACAVWLAFVWDRPLWKGLALVAAGAIWAIAVHSPTHWLVGRAIGIRFTDYFLGGPPPPRPGSEDRLRAPTCAPIPTAAPGCTRAGRSPRSSRRSWRWLSGRPRALPGGARPRCSRSASSRS